MTRALPLFASKTTLAGLLDVSPSTIDAYVRDGILPRPIYLTAGCARFDMDDVIAAVRTKKLPAQCEMNDFAKAFLNAQDSRRGRCASQMLP